MNRVNYHARVASDFPYYNRDPSLYLNRNQHLAASYERVGVVENRKGSYNFVRSKGNSLAKDYNI